MSTRRKSLFRVLDAVDACLRVFTPGGELLYSSTPLRDLPLTADQEAALLQRARELAAEAESVRGSGRSEGEVGLGDRTYRLCVSTVDGLPFGPDIAVVVTVHADGAAPTGASEVTRSVRAARELGLTPREAEVAVPLARRRTNREIADRLAISVHTARHHAERIFTKLDIRSRRQVAAKLFGSEPRD